MEYRSGTAVRSERGRGRRRRARRRMLGGLLILSALLAWLTGQGWAEDPAPRHSATAEPKGLAQDALSAYSGPVELILQNPELPNGCEATSMAMALGAAGCPVDKLTLYGCLPRAPFTERDGQRFGPDPEDAYAGDAASSTGGWYCFEAPVIQAANEWLERRESGLRARSLTGLSRTALERYAQAETPLVVWVTLNYATPQRSDFTWMLEDGTVYRPYCNLHCVVLAGAQGERYRIADPLVGFTLVDKDLFWDSFSAMGRRAVVIE